MNRQELVEALGYIRAVPAGSDEKNVLPDGSETPVSSLEVVTVLVMVGKEVDRKLTTRATLERCGDIKSFGGLTTLVDELLRGD